MNARARSVAEQSPSAGPVGAVLRHSDCDAWLVGLSLVHGALLVTVPSIPLIAIGLWWNANTVAHHFIHRPFFREPVLNRAYAGWLCLLLGLPLALYRDRHLAHHAGQPPQLRPSRDLVIDSVPVLGLWCGMLAFAPDFLLGVYLPGFALGLGLAFVHGHFEHAPLMRSHYGRLYNLVLFNDGYHVEHHADPGRHWTELGRAGRPGPASGLPPVLRWLEGFGRNGLDGLERIVYRCGWLQRWLIGRHEQALRQLLPAIGPVERIGIVGGGLFPRSVIVMRRLFPAARIRVLDASARHIAMARRYLRRAGIEGGIELIEGTFGPDTVRLEADLIVTPLALIGDRGALYRRPPAPFVLVHDWLWCLRTERGAVVSLLLLKRINLVTAKCARSASS